MILTLPYPDKALWPNGRAHWAPKARATKSARRMADWLTVAEKYRGRATQPADAGGAVKVAITVYPKARGPKPDQDNAQAACKAYLDGIADALGVNDRFFNVTTRVADERLAKVEIVL